MLPTKNLHVRRSNRSTAPCGLRGAAARGFRPPDGGGRPRRRPQNPPAGGSQAAGRCRPVFHPRSGGSAGLRRPLVGAARRTWRGTGNRDAGCTSENPARRSVWKGLINDPRLDGSYELEEGLHIARRLLLDIANLGRAGRDGVSRSDRAQYTADLITWAAIGARTTESQTHREMASGLSMPVGFKNGTNGSLQVAIDAMRAARHPHSFLGVDEHGRTSIIRTTGNPGGPSRAAAAAAAQTTAHQHQRR